MYFLQFIADSRTCQSASCESDDGQDDDDAHKYGKTYEFCRLNPAGERYDVCDMPF
jgi:hypothetical protein